MIYILSGNDTKKKKNYLKKLSKNNFLFLDIKNELNKKELLNQAQSISLFGETTITVLDNLLSDRKIDLSNEDLNLIKESKNIFVFLEDKLLISDIKKYKKYAIIEDFKLIEPKQIPKINIFSIADSFSHKDKIGTWILYRQAISLGTSPEEVCGIIFWKVKSMILNNNKIFSQSELKRISSKLTSIYHRSHSGELDFTIALEELILSSLNKKRA